MWSYFTIASGITVNFIEHCKAKDISDNDEPGKKNSYGLSKMPGGSIQNLRNKFGDKNITGTGTMDGLSPKSNFPIPNLKWLL